MHQQAKGPSGDLPEGPSFVVESDRGESIERQ